MLRYQTSANINVRAGEVSPGGKCQSPKNAYHPDNVRIAGLYLGLGWTPEIGNFCYGCSYIRCIKYERAKKNRDALGHVAKTNKRKMHDFVQYVYLSAIFAEKTELKPKAANSCIFYLYNFKNQESTNITPDTIMINTTKKKTKNQYGGRYVYTAHAQELQTILSK